ncbi:MAG: P-loop NTPase fold protein [Pseudomonadota bacterium]
MGETPQPLDGDRPIQKASEDALGFASAARHVASAIVEAAPPDGFVVGIEGEWGSGKSSFINLLAEALAAGGNAPQVVRFLPWLIGSRHGLLKEMFLEIAKAALRIEVKPDEAGSAVERGIFGWRKNKRVGEREARRKRIGELLGKYSSRLIAAAKVAEAFGTPWAGNASRVLESGAGELNKWAAGASLDSDKAQLDSELRFLTKKIVVFIDDLDRLEPAEACEVLRLVRAVADFPNVIYVLCYSRAIVARNLAAALKIEDGAAFLEKIVQVTYSIPSPEAFDLRSMFRQEVTSLYPNLLANDEPATRRLRDRLASVIDSEGGRTLRTPRDVVRTVNALRFHATPVLEQIDLADMVWLQLIRIRCTALHQWIESYMVSVAALSQGAQVASGGRDADFARLKDILEGEDKWEAHDTNTRFYDLSEYLPGIETDKVYNLSTHEVAQAVAARRLGSPQHYRYYFALTAPKGAVTDVQFQSFIEKAETAPGEAAELFRSLARTVRSPGGVMASAILDRLQGKAMDQFEPHVVRGLMQAIAHGMDDAALTIGKGDWGRYWIWNDAGRVLKAGLQVLNSDQRSELVRELFANADSLGWLTDLFRGEVFAHGVYGDKPQPEKEWLLSAGEYEVVSDALLARYRAMTPEVMKRTPNVHATFYAWHQSRPGSEDEIRGKIAELSRDDSDFLVMLESMRSWRAVNGAVSYPLRKSELDWLLNFDEVESRLKRLAAGSEDLDKARRVADLINAIALGQDD